jgi:hypothetical protein
MRYDYGNACQMEVIVDNSALACFDRQLSRHINCRLPKYIISFLSKTLVFSVYQARVCYLDDCLDSHTIFGPFILYFMCGLA